jgi:hypothetical protein
VSTTCTDTTGVDTTGIDTIDTDQGQWEETRDGMADASLAVLVATQSWSLDPIPPPPVEGQRHIVWPIHTTEAGWDAWAN